MTTKKLIFTLFVALPMLVATAGCRDGISGTGTAVGSDPIEKPAPVDPTPKPPAPEPSDPVDPPIDPEPSDPDPVDPPVDPEPDDPIVTPPINNGYECSNAKPIGEGLTKTVYQKSFKNGVTYRSYAEATFDENGEKVPAQPLYLLGARLSGEGINGGLCYDSISHAQKEFAIRSYDAFSCNNIKDLGERVQPNLGLNPSATLTRKLNENTVYDLGIRYSGGDIPGGICFASVENGFDWLAWAKNGQVLGELKYTNPDAPYAGENVRLTTNEQGQGYFKLGGQELNGRLAVKWAH